MDILFENGTIRTLERNSPDAQALLVRNGRIAAVGGRTAVEDQTGIDVRRVDLAGRTLLPAFLDAHSHFTAVANQFLQVSLEGCTSWADMQDRIRDYIRRERIPAGQWVTAQGYDHNLLSERRHPDRLCLDAAAPDNPVVICHQSGHMGVFNTAALERLGVTAQTPAPAGGVIGRENGTLTGYMEENAFLEFQKRVPMRPLESFLAAYRKAQDLYASYGITTVQEGLLRRELVPLYQALLADGSLKLDVVAYGDPEGAEAARQAFPESVRQYHRRFKLGGYKMFLDGSPQGRTAWLRRPYQGEQEYRGYGTLTDAEVLDMVRRAGTDGMQLLAHCNGDRAAEQYLTVLDPAAREAGKRRLPTGDDPRPAAGQGPAAGGEAAGGDPLLLCGPCVPLGGCPCGKLRGPGRARHQPGGGAGPGDPLHIPPGFAGDPARYAGDGLVRREPGDPAGPRPGPGRAGGRPDGPGGGDGPRCIPVF